MKYNIIHITTHLGGGVGTVLLNWLETDIKNKNIILCLNHTYHKERSIYKKEHENRIIFENMKYKKEKIYEYVIGADIVVVHFWNHPYMMDFLINTNLPECRLCTWGHASGLFPPYIHPRKLIEYSDRMIFSSPISYKAKEVIELPERLKKRLGDIWTTGNIDEFRRGKKEHSGFNVCYLGTLDFTKLHVNFVDMCKRIDSPDTNFIVIGVGPDAEKIKAQVRDCNLENKFTFTGMVEDVRPYFEVSDVFGYPLNPTHFGTCEQVIGEALAAGLVPVTLNNPAEEYILSRSQINFACESEDEYIEVIKLLRNYKQLLPKMLKIMQSKILPLYDSSKMVDRWDLEFDSIMKKEKRKRIWTISNDRREMGGAGLFLESLDDKTVDILNNEDETRDLFFSNPQWSSARKGSPIQYHDIFKNDKLLGKWSKLAKEVRNER